ncbi:hypothetical protein LI951_04110 [Enterococcus sp. BWT-B8]|nr:hypothetical protein [Enterococcus sp. BWT-B8]MCB5951243.1 hypothetical protein [Enterococcus sp. BWT-B8]
MGKSIQEVNGVASDLSVRSGCPILLLNRVKSTVTIFVNQLLIPELALTQ